MGIPIKNYIDVSATDLNSDGSNRDYCGLLFTTEVMKASTGTSDPYNKIKSSYGSGNVCELSSDDVTACFATGDVTDFASNYFGFSNTVGGSPSVLYVVKYASGSSKDTTFTNVIAKFSNFGAFTFLDEGDSAVAKSNSGLGKQYVYVCGNSSGTVADNIKDFAGCHFMKFSAKKDLAYPIAWVATRDYDSTNGTGSIDYTEFAGATATVEDGTTKKTLDTNKVNYIGHVQQRGIDRSFYQCGVNLDGMDLGVYCDCAWIQSEIEAGWINMAIGGSKIPANKSGMMRVRAMIIDVAERAIDNGCILIEKPLSNAQISEVETYTGDENASTTIQTTGYYIATKLSVDKSSRWCVKYILVYAKGDHIGKVAGNHFLS